MTPPEGTGAAVTAAMPPGKEAAGAGAALRPVLRRKVDELFLRWLSDPDTQRALREGLRRIRAAAGDAGSGGRAAGTAGDAGSPRRAAHAAGNAGSAGDTRDDAQAAGDARRAAGTAGDAGKARDNGRDAHAAGDARRDADAGPGPPVIPCATPPPGPTRAAARRRRTEGVKTVQAPPPLTPPTPSSHSPLPAFFFPRGRPPPAPPDVDAAIARVEHVFAQLPHQRAAPVDMGRVAKACGCPLYWKGALFYSAGGERTGSVSVHAFVAMWRKVLLTCHDDAARFVQLLTAPGSCGGNGLGQEDFVPFLQDVVNSHPGLSFLKEATEFHSRYITTVIQRIFYTVNRSWSGRITCAELRRSRFLQNVARLETEPDINRLTEFFSYEHFYVIYCKFWELDGDHDLLLDAGDLGRHGDRAISSRMIDRIFSGAVTRGRKVQKGGKMSYADFVWFLLSEEDKTTPTSIEYWFRCMDLDGDGVLSLFELEHFYLEQAQRLDARHVEPLPFRDCVCQMLDLVRPRDPGRITLRDLKRCKQAGVFFDTFFNVDKYLDREQREQQGGLLGETEGGGPELTDWDKYAAEEYDFLVAEEAAGATGDAWDDGLSPDPVGQKPSALRSLGRGRQWRPLLESRMLGAVDLYEFADDDDEDDEDDLQ